MGLIFVVARNQVARLEALRASLVGAEDLLIMMDRREDLRRRGDVGRRPSGDRRLSDRRLTDIDNSLRMIGWALVEQSP